MDREWKQTVWQQYGAAIDMLENAIRACPESLWREDTRPVQYQFWYLVYHTLFFIDFDLAESKASFALPAGHQMTELDPDGAYPERVYTQAEMLEYLAHDREKCRATIAAMTDELAARHNDLRPELALSELLLYSMRHVQHHTAQLQWLLRQAGVEPPRWVRKTGTPLVPASTPTR